MGCRIEISVKVFTSTECNRGIIGSLQARNVGARLQKDGSGQVRSG